MGIRDVDAFNAGLREFAKREGPQAAAELQRRIAIAALPKVVLKTPVDDGEARGGWQLSVGTLPPPEPGRFDPSGNGTIATETAKAAQIGDFQVVFISNGVPHAVTLDRGGYLPKNPATDDGSLARRAARRDEKTRRRAELIGGHPGTPLIRDGYSLQAPRGMVDVAFEELRREFGF